MASVPPLKIETALSSKKSAAVKTVAKGLKTLLKAKEKDEEKYIPLLEKLEGLMPVTIKIIKDTSIGKILSKLKGNKSKIFDSKATALAKAKRLLGKMRSAANVERTQSPRYANKKSASPRASKSKKRSREGSPKIPKPKKVSREVSREIDYGDLETRRVKSRKCLRKSLKMACGGKMSQEDDEKNIELSNEIETCCLKLGYGKWDSMEYKNSVSTLMFALRSNHALRERLVRGDITPSALVHMSPKEMATEESRKQLAAAVDDAYAARDLDWKKNNINKMLAKRGISTEGMYQCFQCKGYKTTSTERQTRSADEPMTTFVSCTQCGAQRRIYG